MTCPNAQCVAPDDHPGQPCTIQSLSHVEQVGVRLHQTVLALQAAHDLPEDRGPFPTTEAGLPIELPSKAEEIAAAQQALAVHVDNLKHLTNVAGDDLAGQARAHAASGAWNVRKDLPPIEGVDAETHKLLLLTGDDDDAAWAHADALLDKWIDARRCETRPGVFGSPGHVIYVENEDKWLQAAGDTPHEATRWDDVEPFTLEGLGRSREAGKAAAQSLLPTGGAL